MRNLKTLAVSMAAVLAMSLVAASGASAGEYHSEVESTTLSGSQIGTDVFTTNAGTVKCNEATYTGSQTGKTSSEVTINPTYSECTAFGFAGATVEVNMCHYVYNGGVEHLFSPTRIKAATLKIVCNTTEGKEITVVAKLAGVTKCTVHIPPQEGLQETTFDNEGAGSSRDIRATVNVTGIKYSQTAGTGIGACKTENNLTNGTYVGEATIKGFDSGGTQKGIWAE